MVKKLNSSKGNILISLLCLLGKVHVLLGNHWPGRRFVIHDAPSLTIFSPHTKSVC
jgi:hypothetical protein